MLKVLEIALEHSHSTLDVTKALCAAYGREADGFLIAAEGEELQDSKLDTIMCQMRRIVGDFTQLLSLRCLTEHYPIVTDLEIGISISSFFREKVVVPDNPHYACAVWLITTEAPPRRVFLADDNDDDSIYVIAGDNESAGD